MSNYKRSKSQKKNGGSRTLRRSRSAKRGGRRATKSSRGGQRAKIGGAGGTNPTGIRQMLTDAKQNEFDGLMYQYFPNGNVDDANFTAHMTKDNLRALVNAKSTDLNSNIQVDFKPYIQ